MGVEDRPLCGWPRAIAQVTAMVAPVVNSASPVALTPPRRSMPVDLAGRGGGADVARCGDERGFGCLANCRNLSAPGPIRTADLSLRRRALYPLSYGRECPILLGFSTDTA